MTVDWQVHPVHLEIPERREILELRAPPALLEPLEKRAGWAKQDDQEQPVRPESVVQTGRKVPQVPPAIQVTSRTASPLYER